MSDSTARRWSISSPDHPGTVTHYSLGDEPHHPDAARLVAYWRACEARDGLVVGTDIPSKAIAPLLKHLFVAEPVNDDTDYRIRIAGSTMRQRYDREITGMLISELYSPALFAANFALAQEVIATGAPRILDACDEELHVLRTHLEFVVLRVFAPQRERHWLLAGTFFFN